MKKLRDFIEKISMRPALTALVIFGFATIIIVGITYIKYQYKEDFFKNILVEAHGMLFDILIIGVLIFALQRLGEKRLKRELDIKRWQEEIDDFRGWKSEEAMYKIVGNIKRLNREGISRIKLTESFLENADLRYVNLTEANLWGTNLTQAILFKAILMKAGFENANANKSSFMNANLKEADFLGANLKGTDFRKADMTWADLRETNLIKADFWGTNLNTADLTDANLKGANLLGAENLTFHQLSQVKTLYQAKLDPELEQQVKEKYPYLLEKPEEEEEESDGE